MAKFDLHYADELGQAGPVGAGRVYRSALDSLSRRPVAFSTTKHNPPASIAIARSWFSVLFCTSDSSSAARPRRRSRGVEHVVFYEDREQGTREEEEKGGGSRRSTAKGSILLGSPCR